MHKLTSFRNAGPSVAWLQQSGDGRPARSEHRISFPARVLGEGRAHRLAKIGGRGRGEKLVHGPRYRRGRHAHRDGDLFSTGIVELKAGAIGREFQCYGKRVGFLGIGNTNPATQYRANEHRPQHRFSSHPLKMYFGATPEAIGRVA